MSKSNSEKQGIPNLVAPTAPFAASPEAGVNFHHDYPQRAPPPSYQESLTMYASAQPNGVSYMPAQAPSYMRYAPPSYSSPYASQQAQVPMGMNANAYNYAVYSAPQQHYQPQQFATVQVQQAFSSEPPMLALAKGAKIRTTNTGAISIPPPPPGCAPTAAQIAAMQGQPVLVKKTKKSFF